MLMECDNCRATVDAVFEKSYEIDDRDRSSCERLSFLRCPRCSRAFVVSARYTYTMWEGSRLPHDDEDEEQTVLFPAAGLTVNPSVPNNVRSSFVEALKCSKAGALTACVIMCRKAIEAMCREHGVDAPLGLALESLRDDDVIDNRLFEWANLLRLAGNEAAHDVDSAISPEDAADVIDFTRALLEYTFTFRDKFSAFFDRRKESGKPDVEDTGKGEFSVEDDGFEDVIMSELDSTEPVGGLDQVIDDDQ